jgi:hypothetical protein
MRYVYRKVIMKFNKKVLIVLCLLVAQLSGMQMAIPLGGAAELLLAEFNGFVNHIRRSLIFGDRQLREKALRRPTTDEEEQGFERIRQLCSQGQKEGICSFLF